LVVADRALRADLASYASLVAEELNVLEIAFPGDDEAGTFVTYKLKPNFRTLGQKGMGKEAQTLKKAMAALDDAGAAQLLTTLQATGSATLDGVSFDEADVEREFLTKEGFAAAGDRVGVVVLDARLDDELVREGVLREVKSAIQQVRKDRKLEFTARIALKIAVSDDALRGLFETRKEWLAGEVLASTLAVEASPSSDSGYERIEANGVELFVQIA
jgi:isoleucyl-tRNA synthetase